MKFCVTYGKRVKMTSRVARNPIAIPKNVEVTINKHIVNVKGPKGNIDYQIPNNVTIAVNDNKVQIQLLDDERDTNAIAGTARANINNNIIGVSDGYEKKLLLKGVGYKAALKDKALHLSLGFSHPVEYKIPVNITIDVPNQTEIVIKGSSKQQVGQVAAEIRRYRPPEPYKGKGIRYDDEKVDLKETKKK